jgi:hypothetical protein
VGSFSDHSVMVRSSGWKASRTIFFGCLRLSSFVDVENCDFARPQVPPPALSGLIQLWAWVSLRPVCRYVHLVSYEKRTTTGKRSMWGRSSFEDAEQRPPIVLSNTTVL